MIVEIIVVGPSYGTILNLLRRVYRFRCNHDAAWKIKITDQNSM